MQRTLSVHPVLGMMGALVAALAMALIFVLPTAADTNLTTVLSGDAEVPGPGDDGGSGVAIVDVATAGEVCFTIEYTVTSGVTTAGHIHEAAVDAAGPVVVTLYDTADNDGFVEGCVTIDPALAADLEANPADYYINLHNTDFPNGAIRGQLGVQAATVVQAYINPDLGLATENPNVDPNSSCEAPQQTDTQAVSPAGETTNNVHTDACLFDELGFAVDTQVSFEVGGVGVISACPDPDMGGPKTATLSGDGLTCTLSGYQESGGAMAGDFEYHVRTNSETAGEQTVTFCIDPEGDGCGNATISDTNTITWFETGMIMLMKHYCNADDSNPDTTVDVRSEEEFMAVEAGGGDDPVVAVALTVLACPVERLPGDEPVADTIAHFEEEFDFTVTDELGNEFTLADSTFTQLHACEQDRSDGPLVIGEVDGDPETNVCVDFSFYAIEGVAEGEVTVVETFHEGEHEFGTVRFTPAELDPDDDSRTLLGFDRETSTVRIDTSLDGDAMVMLHVYNFDTAAAGGPAPTTAPSATPAAGELPDTAGSSQGASTLALVMVVLSIGSLLALSIGVRRSRQSH